MKAIIQDEPIDKLEKVHRHEQKISISPHASKALAHRHVLLRNLLHRAVASVVLAGHDVWLDLQEGEESRYKVCEGGEAQRNMSGCECRCVQG